MRFLAFLLLLLLNVPLNAQLMDIGILRDMNVQQISVTCYGEGSILINDTLYERTLKHGEIIVLSRYGGKVSYKDSSGANIYVGSVTFLTAAKNTYWGIKVSGSARKERQYYGNIVADSQEDGLRVINKVRMRDYIAGVVQAESGVNQNIEYYKVQAILARTFALKNISKHADEGFMLTDLVNCQAYHGRCTYPERIEIAVDETEGMVVTDQHHELITAVYHSNSGGQTANPESVWNKPLPYLRSVIDTFSIGTRSYKWTKTLTETEWLGYLRDKHSYPVDDSLARLRALNYKQLFRDAFFVHSQYGIPLRDIRTDFKLNSTFFNVVPVSNGNIELRGRGFGHGVGLSQEGAMVMSRNGYDYRQIIDFYFHNVIVTDIKHVIFYRETVQQDIAGN
jgi:stage II sporulation protein D